VGNLKDRSREVVGSRGRVAVTLWVRGAGKRNESATMYGKAREKRDKGVGKRNESARGSLSTWAPKPRHKQKGNEGELWGVFSLFVVVQKVVV